MSIAIIGATGQLGGHAIDALLERGVAPGDLVALGRNTNRLASLSDRGLRVGSLDLADTKATAAQLTGVDALVLISVGGMNGGLEPRVNAVEAARIAEVPHVVYTSVLQAPTTQLVIAADHAATEEAIAAAALPATLLRNGWYTENQQPDFDSARSRGVVANSIGAGRIASAPRREYGEAIAAVLTTPGHVGHAYELSGDVAWSFADFAATAQDVLGSPVRYDVLTPEAEHDVLLAAGLDEDTARLFIRAYADMRQGALELTTGDLSRLIGHPTEPLALTLRAWLDQAAEPDER